MPLAWRLVLWCFKFRTSGFHVIVQGLESSRMSAMVAILTSALHEHSCGSIYSLLAVDWSGTLTDSLLKAFASSSSGVLIQCLTGFRLYHVMQRGSSQVGRSNPPKAYQIATGVLVGQVAPWEKGILPWLVPEALVDAVGYQGPVLSAHVESRIQANRNQSEITS